MWRQLKTITGTPISAALHPDPQAEANRLIEHFTSRSHSNNLPPLVKQAQDALAPLRTAAIQQAAQESADTDTPFTYKELAQALKHYKKSAPGEDRHTYEMIDNSPPDFKLRLLTLVNSS